jgi:hypothetical protein
MRKKVGANLDAERSPELTRPLLSLFGIAILMHSVEHAAPSRARWQMHERLKNSREP